MSESTAKLNKKIEISFEVVRNDCTDRALILLTGAKNIFQKQLPKMPKEYITRLVYCRKHTTLVIVKNGNPFQLVGAITYRSFPEGKFVEIVFCAISSDEQVQGYGSLLMNQLKEQVKKEGDYCHFLTYADNYAVGYFKKQYLFVVSMKGFTKDLSGFDRKWWAGCIKDYDGGTLMLCTMVPCVDYLQVKQMLHQQKEVLDARIRALSAESFVPRSGIRLQEGQVLHPREIPGVLEAGWDDAMLQEIGDSPQKGQLFDVLKPLISALANHPSSWPFLQPVNRAEVPEYYDIIKEPMDLGTMEDKVEGEKYGSLEQFAADFALVYHNCKLFNDPASQYAKCADRLNEFFQKKLQDALKKRSDE